MDKAELRNVGRKSRAVIEWTKTFLPRFEPMAKPVIESSIEWRGTVTDNQLLVCRTGDRKVWASIVLVKTASLLWAVLVPICEGPDRQLELSRFLHFLREGPEYLQVSYMKLSDDSSQWDLQDGIQKWEWPRDGKLFGDAGQMG